VSVHDSEYFEDRLSASLFVLIFFSGGCLSVFPSAGGAVDGVVVDIPPEVTI
jgi:hypothetical protein